MAAVVAVTMGATACSENGAAITAPGETASFQRQNVAQGAFGGLIAALNNINAQIIALNNLDVDVGDITVVDIDNLNLTIQQVRILNNVLNNNQVDIGVLQNFLNNANIDVDISNFLNNNNILITDVIAIDVLSGGDLVIFTR
jgi:hypothetical protein